MSRKIDATKLSGIFQMISSPSERVKFHYGSPPDDVINFLLRSSVAPTAAGALDAKALLDWVSKLPKFSNTNNNASFNSNQLRFSTTIDDSSNIKISDVENPRALFVKALREKNSDKAEFKSIKMLDALGAKTDANYRSCPVSFVISNIPMINPSVGRAADVEIFLNYMPSYVLSRMVPYVDVEFQFTRPYTERAGASPSQLNSTGLLKFLNGAIQFNLPAKNSNDVMALGHRILRDKDTQTIIDEKGQFRKQQLERSYAGMEIFTSPQTLVNPEQLDASLRYKDVLDPFRPFMSLISLNLTAAPTVGYGTYKTGNMVLKLHDRSRLSEIGDLLQPEIYTRTVMWITSGWVHPVETDNPYTEFINNNMLVRELYGIKNASYAFENDGQVTITLQLYTMGATEMMDIKISAGPDDDGSPSVESIKMSLDSLVSEIAYIANKMGVLNQTNGGTSDIRAYHIINSAARGEFPNLSDEDVLAVIKKLSQSLNKNSKVDKADVKELIDKLNTMYAVTGSGKDKKYAYDVKRKNAADAVIYQKLSHLGKPEEDPWLPFVIPGVDSNKKSPYADNPFAKEIKQYESNIVVKSSTLSKAPKPSYGVCSFAKLISTFIAPQIAESQICDEFQVFFYAFNECSGLAAGQSIANFPIDLSMFLDQFSLFVQQKGSSRLSLSEFLRFVLDSQLHDHRSLGYGTRAFFKPYKSGEVATLNESKQNKEAFEGWMTQHMSKYGPFHLPAIDTHLEMIPLISSESEIVDMFSELSTDRSAKESIQSKPSSFKRKTKYALRLHIYDKQLNPYKAIESAVKPPSGKPGHTILINENVDAIKYREKEGKEKIEELFRKLSSPELSEQQKKVLSVVNGDFSVPMDLSSNQKVKDYISSVVPTILFCSNGSSITSANLSTGQDALLSSVQMMKQSGRTNPQTPAGAGPGGLPITVIPGKLTMTSLGCPLAQLVQKYFVDFNTGTTADNIYCVNALTHQFTPGKFETSWTFVWADGYGRIAGAADVQDYLKFIEKSLPDKPSSKK